ncbi:RNA polymerase sporulation sigma factor SigK [Blautia luti]|uniref:RNA polymerase sigma factor n=1 Tax=Blautia luti DSM 14534 = JCM 17040 TaxID=649762 RepID=A0A844GKL0_9FIRM|nr:RNA polymerase sporulation sigma factor SigK [Blautia luti]MTD61148.1 sigma-70 family RNA polymerase sigma factor [Blautia luti DSM 14534 = JCM 17040]BEI61398.1 RNA polymerase sporulation sigma factor SigK [Blautia luti]
MKAFLKPLSISQEKYYLLKYKEGDLHAKNLLIEHNLRLVAHVVKKYQGVDEETDDLISIGTIGLIKAITTFDPQKAARLSTYAARCIENEILMFLRSKRRRSREVSLYEPIGTDKEGNEINLLDVIESTPVDIVEDCYMRENTSYLLRSLKDTLTEKEYQVICCRYGLFGEEEQTQREIAHRLSISRSYVSRIEKNAIEKLRILFENK